MEQLMFGEKYEVVYLMKIHKQENYAEVEQRMTEKKLSRVINANTIEKITLVQKYISG